MAQLNTETPKKGSSKKFQISIENKPSRMLLGTIGNKKNLPNKDLQTGINYFLYRKSLE